MRKVSRYVLFGNELNVFDSIFLQREADTVWELDQFKMGGTRFICIKEEMIETINCFLKVNAELIQRQDVKGFEKIPLLQESKIRSQSTLAMEKHQTSSLTFSTVNPTERPVTEEVIKSKDTAEATVATEAKEAIEISEQLSDLIDENNDFDLAEEKEDDSSKEPPEKRKKSIFKREMMKKANYDRINEIDISFFKRSDDEIREVLKIKNYNHSELFWIAVRMGQKYLTSSLPNLCQILDVKHKDIYSNYINNASNMAKIFEDNASKLQKLDATFFRRPKKEVQQDLNRWNYNEDKRQMIAAYAHLNLSISLKKICDIFDIRKKSVDEHITRKSKMEDYDSLSPSEFDPTYITATYVKTYASNFDEALSIIEEFKKNKKTKEKRKK